MSGSLVGRTDGDQIVTLLDHRARWPLAARIPSAGVSRRLLLRAAGAAALGGAAALTPFAALAQSAGPAAGTAPPGTAASLRKLTLAWNATSICTAAAPVAEVQGIFARHGIAAEFVNFGGSTETLLEAIATGKADAGIGMALRWLKPLEQGFDVKVTAGVHGGCLRLLAGKDSGIAKLEDLRGKTVAISDQASPAKNFFSIFLTKRGVDASEVEWRQYPMDLLPLAVQKGEAHALADSDPRTYIWRHEPHLVEIATNMSEEYASRTCCLLALRGSLIRDERAVAAQLTKAVLEAGRRVAQHPSEAASIYANYGGKGSIEDLQATLEEQGHEDQVLGDELKKQLVLYTEELKLVNVIRRNTNSERFADRIFVDVLSGRNAT